MSKPTALAALLMGLTCAVHVFAGGPEIMDPVHQQFDGALRLTLWVVWHGVTTALLVMTGALAWMAWHPNAAFRALCLGLMLGFAGLFVVAALQIPGGFALMPQWAIFGVIAALTWAGGRRVSS